jgi:anti-sigma B factor antagonist
LRQLRIPKELLGAMTVFLRLHELKFGERAADLGSASRMACAEARLALLSNYAFASSGCAQGSGVIKFASGGSNAASQANAGLQGGSGVSLRMLELESEGVTILKIDGRIVLGEESNAFRERVKSFLAEGKTKIVLNVEHVTYIDSAGLGALVAAHASARTRGATLKMAQLGVLFTKMIQMTRLFTVFDVYPTEAEALRSFKS